uniref:GRIP and coiled-coil domain-containing protein 1 n=1 Tax=Denticeps clupeoides TaxID=299321 RepID=A0AAY4EY18_9TELE
MEKFGMSFGGGPGKKELLDTIEAQKKQLVQYQTRFKDVVRAYKSLLKEKEALEASLKVLTVSQEVDLGHSLHSEDSLDTAVSAETATSVASGSTKGDLGEEDQSGSGGDVVSGHTAPTSTQRSDETSGSESGISSTSSGGPDQPSHSPAEPDRRLQQLKAQLTTLTSSLATVTQEKSRMEASFQADKRKMKQEMDELQTKMEEMQQQHEAEMTALQEQLAESKARVITQQHEREQEQGDHALMLRELQKLLKEERDRRQDAELKLEDTRETLAETMQAADRGLDFEAKLKEAIQEREEMRRTIRAAELERNKPDPRVEELLCEAEALKIHFQQQLQHEIGKASQADKRLREQAQLDEGRVASLEQRVSELSDLLGAAEKVRQKDQQNIQMLRERILQLDTENKTLAIAASSRVTDSDLNIDEADLDVNDLKEKLERVKKLLKLAGQRRSQDSPLEIDKLGDEEEMVDGEIVQYYKQQLHQVKEEFERYKVRAQVVLKNKNTKDGNQAKELEETREQLAELKEKYINLRIHMDEMVTKHKQDLDEHQQGVSALQLAKKQELERQEAQHRENFLRLEEELHKQRNRTMALLTEKDQELERLRAANYGVSERLVDASVVDGDAQLAEDSAQGENDFISHALNLAGPNEHTLLLLYAEQLARKDAENRDLRKQKHSLEQDLHQLQEKLIANGERHEEEAAELRAQLDKRLRDQGRDGANLEYLKNVIYKYLTLQDTRGRQQTLTAILTILHFSPQEKQAVVKHQAPSWWAAGMR